MKIALIDPVGGKMGMNHYDDGLMNSLSLQGFDCFIISNYKSQFENIHSVQFFSKLNKTWISAIYNNVNGIIKSLMFCRKQKMAYLIFHIFRGGLFDLFSVLLSKIAGFKIILIVHDIETIDTTANKFIKRFLLSRSYKALIVHNQYSAIKLKKFLGQKEIKNLQIIPHGNYIHAINATFARNEAINDLGFDPSSRYVLFYGQIKKSKGLDLLLEAIQHSNTDFKLIIAGKLRIKNFAAYQKIIDKYNMGNRVLLLLKHMSNEETNRLFAACEVVVLPYRAIYQSGVLLLAMSYGKTVIASDLPPFEEIIRHGENGLLFKKNNPDELAKILHRVYLKEFNLEKINHEARKQAEENFSWQQIGYKFSVLFEK